eukprot:8716487-Alexandrium_andersonii.AAC.1
MQWRESFRKAWQKKVGDAQHPPLQPAPSASSAGGESSKGGKEDEEPPNPNGRKPKAQRNPADYALAKAR